MKNHNGITVLSEYTPSDRAKKIPYFSGSDFQIFKIILIISILALAALFLPFAKSAVLALIFSFALLEAKERVKKLSKNKKILFFTAAGALVLVIITVATAMMNRN